MGVDREVRREVAAPKEMTPETTGYGAVMLRCATATENNVEWTSKERHRTTATTEEDVKWDVMRKSAIDDDEVDVVIARDNGAKTLRCATAPSDGNNRGRRLEGRHRQRRRGKRRRKWRR